MSAGARLAPTSASILPSPILVTGANGFVGRHLCTALTKHVSAPAVISTSLHGAAGERALDFTDPAAVDLLVARERPAALVHLAAQSSVGLAEQDAARTFAVNLGGTLNLALAVARSAPGATVLFASSSEVYGHAFGVMPIGEEVAPQPVNAYARSKLMSEEVLAAVLPQGARLVVARPFNHTGAGQSEMFVLPSFAGQIARIEAELQPPVLRVGNLEAQRDLIDVRDLVAAYIALLASTSRLPFRFTCNIGSGTAHRLGDILEALRRLSRVPFAVEVDPGRLRPLDVPYAAGSIARLTGATGWTPTTALEDTVAELLDDARRRVGETRKD